MDKTITFLCFSNDNVRDSEWAIVVNSLHKALFGDALPLVNKLYLEGSARGLSFTLSFRLLPEKFIAQNIARKLLTSAHYAKIDITPKVDALCAIIPQLKPWLTDCKLLINPRVKLPPIIRTGEISLL